MYTIEYAKNLRWVNADHTMFDCTVKMEELQEEVECSINATDPYAHIQTLCQTCGVKKARFFVYSLLKSTGFKNFAGTPTTITPSVPRGSVPPMYSGWRLPVTTSGDTVLSMNWPAIRHHLLYSDFHDIVTYFPFLFLL